MGERMYADDKLMNTASELVNFFFSDSRFRTHDQFRANHVGKGGFIFRGQSCATWPLWPATFRKGNPLAEFTPQTAGEPTDTTNIHQHLWRHLQAEERAIFLFLKYADSVGLPTPIDYAKANEVSDQMQILRAGNANGNFDRSTPYPVLEYQRAAALAQHHGVPTRLLDWSESPLVACYFAASAASRCSGLPIQENQEIAVYFFNSELLNDASSIEIIEVPRHNNSHLRQQQGVFLSFKTANTFFLNHSGDWPSLSDCPDISKYVGCRRLPATQAADLLRELFDRGITELTLMPSLTHAAQAYKNIKALFQGGQHRIFGNSAP